jgi:hypothetical protein
MCDSSDLGVLTSFMVTSSLSVTVLLRHQQLLLVALVQTRSKRKVQSA